MLMTVYLQLLTRGSAGDFDQERFFQDMFLGINNLKVLPRKLSHFMQEENTQTLIKAENVVHIFIISINTSK